MAPFKKRSKPETFPNEESNSKRRNVFEDLVLSQQDGYNFRCGKIIRIHLTNFMCHSNLVISFSDRVNFLVGNNGSGKSAILAALVLGLGSKASNTNRSQNMQKFIKTDETFTNIEIEISNSGVDAFNYETYGDKIIIIRHITEKTSCYRIKNAQGTVVSKKVDDLHKIILYHNIQVENPVFVLNQENARVFLKDLDPSKNYELFIKATQIEIIGEKLNDCLRASKLQSLQLNCLGQKLIKKCELERLWILVINQEKKIHEVDFSIEKLISQKNEYENRLQNKESFETESKNALSEIETNLQEKRRIYAEENLKYLSLKNKMVENNDRFNELNAGVESLNKKNFFVKTQIDKLNEYIAQKASDNRVSVQGLRTSNEKELSGLQQQRKDVTAILEGTKRDVELLSENKGRIDQKIEDLKKNQYRLQEEARNIQSQINNINANSKDALSIYGEHVSRIVLTINKLYQEKQFSEMPRGPLGRYIEVVDERFRNAVENQLGGLINSFVVSNNRDYKILENVLKKHQNFNPTIITTKFMNKVYDVSKGIVSPPHGTKLLMDQIRCCDTVVLNCLIDRVSIESILLTESKEVAEKFTSTIKSVPKNLRKIILIKPGLEYCPEPSYRIYSLKIQPARFIQVDIRERLYQLELEMKSCREETNLCESMLRELNSQLHLAAQNIKTNRNLVEKLEYTERGLCERIHELECFQYPACNEMDLLTNELQECKTKVSQTEKKLEEKIKEASETKIELRGIKEELKEKKVSLNAIETEINQIKSKSDDIRVNLSKFMHNVRAMETELKETDSSVQELEGQRKLMVQTLVELCSDAEKCGSRIDSQRPEKDINEIIRKLKNEIKHKSQSKESPKELHTLIEGKSQTLSKNEELYLSVKETLEMLNDSRIKRFRFIKHLKRHMAMKVIFTFQGILSYRQFTGDISIDHDERKLTLSIFPRDHGLEGSISSTKALSGGERSFSTVAFLLSLWSCVDHPFYLLDEYDVFTDEVNREVMTQMLLNEAEAKPQRQYTFLSPQDMALETKDYIKIHRLADPTQ
ncbi:structural maintenance of chromosomes protein 6 isoform X2 [Eupeodes corollae]|uniref:structural maintenance of chromosomes protein 6 isoform X2 n=1 Tax=Eupeodes corollae TaxID=290404 RepID=UPI0024911C06|nr:structural maintenance of chromosomes protein 6 isoform X2 [Eupeodes corollae]